jgi:Protein of unknown function (DUF2786)
MSDILDRVRRLLALSKSGNSNEAAAAAAAANRLIDKYRLSEIDLEISGSTAEPVEEDVDYIYETGRTTPWKMRLMGVLVQHYGLAHWNDNHYPQGRKVSRFRLIGRKSDITIAKYMFTWLVTECQRLADLEAKGNGRVYVESFCQGFVVGIADQLKASRSEIQKESTSAAIVKMDGRVAEATDWMRQHRTNLVYGKSSSHVRLDQTGLASGKSKGAAFHLGASLTSASGTKMLNR